MSADGVGVVAVSGAGAVPGAEGRVPAGGWVVPGACGTGVHDGYW
jgi:hypothetical protein